MKGFDGRFADLPDYILGITHEIWEERQVEALRRYYAPDILVRSPSGVVRGNEAVIEATRATLAEFGDRRLLGEDVIWCGNPEDGFLSSHRILSTATHTGDGAYGPATGAKLRYRVIADCAVRDNCVYDEWLVRDQGAIVRQVGLDPKSHAAAQIAAEGGPQSAARPYSPIDDAAPVYAGTGNGHEAGERYGDLLGQVMHSGASAVRAGYDRAAHLELPGGTSGHGHHDAAAFWDGLLSAFPDAAFEIHHRIGRSDPARPMRAALRWSLRGRHSGDGAFGEPSGAMAHVMGISHAEWGPRGLHREWVLIDETAVYKQILLHTG